MLVSDKKLKYINDEINSINIDEIKNLKMKLLVFKKQANLLEEKLFENTNFSITDFKKFLNLDEKIEKNHNDLFYDIKKINPFFNLTEKEFYRLINFIKNSENFSLNIDSNEGIVVEDLYNIKFQFYLNLKFRKIFKNKIFFFNDISIKNINNEFKIAFDLFSILVFDKIDFKNKYKILKKYFIYSEIIESIIKFFKDSNITYFYKTLAKYYLKYEFINEYFDIFQNVLKNKDFSKTNLFFNSSFIFKDLDKKPFLILDRLKFSKYYR